MSEWTAAELADLPEATLVEVSWRPPGPRVIDWLARTGGNWHTVGGTSYYTSTELAMRCEKLHVIANPAGERS